MISTKEASINRTAWTLVLAIVCGALGCTSTRKAGEFRDEFNVNKSGLGPTGVNPFFIPLTPGYRLELGHGNEKLTIVVTDKTRVVDGVECRMVMEVEDVGGKLKEISRNYFAIDRITNDVYYFGEDVDIFKNGRVASHEGAWLSGMKGARFGLMMPGRPQNGDKFYQERAPGVALDYCEIVSVDAKLKTPAGMFEKCVKTREGSDLETGGGQKVYAPGVGLVQDDELVLVKVVKP